MTTRSLLKIERKVSDLVSALEELREEVAEKEDAIDEKASEREDGEMTECEQEKHDALDEFLNNIDDMDGYLEEFESDIETFREAE